MATPRPEDCSPARSRRALPPNAVYSRAEAAVVGRRVRRDPAPPGRRSLAASARSRRVRSPSRRPWSCSPEPTATDLVNAALVLQARTPDEYPGLFCLAPVVDGRLVPRHPMAAFRTGTAHRVPLIIGTNDREGTIFRGRIDILPRSVPRIEAVLARGTPASRVLIDQRLSRSARRRDRARLRRRLRVLVPLRRARRAPFPATLPVYFYRFDVAPRLLRWARPGRDARPRDVRAVRAGRCAASRAR